MFISRIWSVADAWTLKLFCQCNSSLIVNNSFALHTSSHMLRQCSCFIWTMLWRPRFFSSSIIKHSLGISEITVQSMTSPKICYSAAGHGRRCLWKKVQHTGSGFYPESATVLSKSAQTQSWGAGSNRQWQGECTTLTTQLLSVNEA